MKYCTNCGHQMEDDMKFCQRCGTSSAPFNFAQSAQMEHKEIHSAHPKLNLVYTENEGGSTKIDIQEDRIRRPGMRIFGWLFLCFAIFALFLPEDMHIKLIGAIAYATISIICLILSNTPKGNRYIFAKGKPILRRQPVITFIWMLSFVCMMIIMSDYLHKNRENITQSENDIVSQSPIETDSQVEKKESLADVQNWYNNSKGTVSNNFVNLLNTQTITDNSLGSNLSISKTKVTSIDFKFEKNLGCYYVLYFDCLVDNKYKCTGHSRGFIEYKGINIVWWSIEIDYGTTALIDQYNDNYDNIVIDYFNQLNQTYGD